MTITITEALAEIKTINARLVKKREHVLSFLHRQDGLRDPLERDGGSVQMIQRERQSILDLETRIIALRRGIQSANERTEITVGGSTRTISDWLTWKRDVMPDQQRFLSQMRARLAAIREQAKRSGNAVVGISAVATAGQDTKPTDYVINIDEGALAREIETMEEMTGALDGQLSLKNATVMIEA